MTFYIYVCSNGKDSYVIWQAQACPPILLFNSGTLERRWFKHPREAIRLIKSKHPNVRRRPNDPARSCQYTFVDDEDRIKLYN